MPGAPGLPPPSSAIAVAGDMPTRTVATASTASVRDMAAPRGGDARTRTRGTVDPLEAAGTWAQVCRPRHGARRDGRQRFARSLLGSRGVSPPRYAAASVYAHAWGTC